jgi:hypothetical protein
MKTEEGNRVTRSTFIIIIIVIINITEETALLLSQFQEVHDRSYVKLILQTS